MSKVAETAALSFPSFVKALENDPEKQKSLVRIVKKYFFFAETHKRRQLFVLMCGEALDDKDMFFTHFRNVVVALASDHVIGVRMALARILKHHYLKHLMHSLLYDREISFAVVKLQTDRSQDIRQLVSSIPNFEIDPRSSSSVDNPLFDLRSLSFVPGTLGSHQQQ